MKHTQRITLALSWVLAVALLPQARVDYSGGGARPRLGNLRFTKRKTPRPGSVAAVGIARGDDEEDGENTVYVFGDTGNKGYVVASADDIAIPMLGYSDTGVTPRRYPSRPPLTTLLIRNLNPKTQTSYPPETPKVPAPSAFLIFFVSLHKYIMAREFFRNI